jgi:hypothetical protein
MFQHPRFSILRPTILVAMVIAALASLAVLASSGAENTFSIQEWAAAARSLEKFEARIFETRIFNAPKGNAGMVVLANHATAWNLFVLTRGDDSQVHLDWKSGDLDESFGITDRSNLGIVSPNSRVRNLVQFKACNLKASPLVCSILLYDPEKRIAFTVTRDATDKITHSANLQTPENKVYRDWLDRQISGPSGLELNR